MIIRTKHIELYLYMIVLLASVSVFAQRVCQHTKRLTTLSNNVNVFLFKEISSNRIYFLPTILQLSENKGNPELSYQEYIDQGSTSPDGAILHFLVTWGLNKRQFRELALQVKKLYGENASLGGALHLEAYQKDFKITNTTIIGRILNTSLKSKGNPPTTSSGKMAMSFHIKKENVNIITEAFTKPVELTGTFISIHYHYKTYICNKGINVAKYNTIKLIGNIKKWFS